MTFKISAKTDLYPLNEQATLTRRSSSNFLIWYQSLVLGGALVAIYSNAPIYGYIQNPSLLPKYTFFGIFLLIAPLIIIKIRAFLAYLVSPFVLWAITLLILNLIYLVDFSADTEWNGIYLVGTQEEARQSLVLTRIQYIFFAIFLGFGMHISKAETYLYALKFLMIFLPCAVIFDFAKPGEFYPLTSEGAVIGRAAAMFINPTAAGEAILHVFLIGCAVTKMKYRFPLFFLAGAAILTTFSRSSIMAWVLILAILFFKRTMPKSSIIPVAIVLSISLILLGSFESYLLSRQDLDAGASNILARLDFFSSFAFDDDSSEERADVMVAGWELFLQNPITGAGAGATLFWSHRGGTHNQFLLFAAEYGLLGIVLWIWLLAILWNGTFFKDRGLQVAMVFLYVFMSLFTHVMLDSSSYWLATFALISVKGNRAGLTCPDKIRKCD
jgi:O-antigen ligase